MQNNVAKFLLLFNSIFVLAIFVMAMRLAYETKKLRDVENNLTANDALKEMASVQKNFTQEREKTMQEIANAPTEEVKQTETTTTVVPGEVVQVRQTVKKPSKTTRTS